MTRWLLFLLSILVGVGAGLVYGWVITPPSYENTSPETLRIDYQTDYVLMVAEAFDSDKDIASAISRLSVFGNPVPEMIVQDAVDFASQAGYLDTDVYLMQTLLIELQKGITGAETEEP